MTFDSQEQKQAILNVVQDEKLRQQIENAKIVEPWIPEHPINNFVKQGD